MDKLMEYALLIGIKQADFYGELDAMLNDPNGERATELARRLREHADGGVEAVLDAVKIVAVLANKNPHPDDVLREKIAAL